MKTHDADYAGWLVGQTVEQYCSLSVEPVAAEIEHISLIALKDVLLSPAGISLEVVYLDRSRQVGPARGRSLQSSGVLLRVRDNDRVACLPVSPGWD